MTASPERNKESSKNLEIDQKFWSNFFFVLH